MFSVDLRRFDGVTDADPHLLTPNQQNIFSDSAFTAVPAFSVAASGAR